MSLFDFSPARLSLCYKRQRDQDYYKRQKNYCQLSHKIVFSSKVYCGESFEKIGESIKSVEGKSAGLAFTINCQATIYKFAKKSISRAYFCCGKLSIEC